MARQGESKMRRAANYNYSPLPQQAVDAVEAENERMTEELSHKIGALKSLSIDIGHEVRSQERLLRGIDDDMDRTGGFLGNTMNRVIRMSKAGHNYYIFYLFLFSIFVFFLLYIVLKFR